MKTDTVIMALFVCLFLVGIATALSGTHVVSEVRSFNVSGLSITAYYPTATLWPEVADSQRFNVTVDQTTQCRWYVNGILKQTNATPSLTHAYTNTSLKGGGCNVTAAVNNTNGTDSQTWLFEVGADSIDMIILSEDQNNDSCRIRWNVTRIGSNATHWNTSYSYTEAGRTYHKRFNNETEILNQTATINDETLWFNASSLLPTGIYYINVSGEASTETFVNPAWVLLSGAFVVAAGWLAKRWSNRRRKRQ